MRFRSCPVGTRTIAVAVLFFVPAFAAPAVAKTGKTTQKSAVQADPAPAAPPVEGTADEGEGAAPPPSHVVLSHKHQFGLSFMPGIGYRVVAPYDSKIHCDASNVDKKVCSARAPIFMDLQASFAVTDTVDVLAEVRLGLEHEPHRDNHQFAFMPGVRFWVDTDEQLKLYTTVQAVFDNTKQGDAMLSDTDFGFRNANGIMYDHTKHFGVFLQFGETAGFSRWFNITVDVGGGVQARF